MYNIIIEAIYNVFLGKSFTITLKLSPLHLNLSGYAERCCSLLIIVFNIFHIPFMLFFSCSNNLL